MKRIFTFTLVFGVLFALAFFITLAPLNTGAGVPSLFGLATITATPTQAQTQEPIRAPTEEPTRAPTEEPTPALIEEPTLAPIFDPLDQEYFRDYVQGAGADDCIKIDDNRIWDECFDPFLVTTADWPYHILAYEPESYMRNFEVPGGPRSDAGWIFAPVDQPWPLKYSGEIDLVTLNKIFTCAIVSAGEVSEVLWTDPESSSEVVERRDLRILSLVPITQESFTKLVTFSPLLSRFPSMDYNVEKTRKCGELLMP